MLPVSKAFHHLPVRSSVQLVFSGRGGEEEEEEEDEEEEKKYQQSTRRGGA